MVDYQTVIIIKLAIHCHHECLEIDKSESLALSNISIVSKRHSSSFPNSVFSFQLDFFSCCAFPLCASADTRTLRGSFTIGVNI